MMNVLCSDESALKLGLWPFFFNADTTDGGRVGVQSESLFRPIEGTQDALRNPFEI